MGVRTGRLALVLAPLALLGSWTTAARTPWILLAEMETPMPVPQMRIPSLSRPSAIALPTRKAGSG